MMPDRFTRWNRAARVLARIDSSLVATVQWLGRLDIQHLEEDLRLMGLSEKAMAAETEIVRFSDHYTASYLWVLESFKVIHTINQTLSNNRALLPPDLVQSVRDVEQVFRKIECNASASRPAYKTCFFSPVLNRKAGIGWRVAPGVHITRRELSDAFLTLLERIQRVSPKTDIDVREEPRAGFLQAIRFVTDRNNSGTASKGVTVNQSRSGLCIISFHRLNEGQQIRIEHGLKTRHPATVCWVRELDKDIFKAGLQFVS